MKLNLLQKSRLTNLISQSVLLTTLVSACYVIPPESLKSPQLTKLSTANARIAATEGICGYDYTVDIESQLTANGWTKKFEDNFDVSPASSGNHNWNVWVGGAFNNELQMYTPSPNNLSIIPDPDKLLNNLLVINAIKENVTGPKYRQDVDATPTNFAFTSARIESKTMFAPTRTASQMRLVSRIKLPSGYGMWPAFWSYGDNWPTNGEIDILEARGNLPNEFQTNYFFGRKANMNLVQGGETIINTATSLVDCWHVYEVVWTSSSLTFILDGVVIDVKSGNYVPNLFGKLERITFNQAVGGNYFWTANGNPTADQILLNPGEGVMRVDWVKVYSKK